jgi:hypothetical protein
VCEVAVGSEEDIEVTAHTRERKQKNGGGVFIFIITVDGRRDNT